jgi:nucleotide-binding universal stress UspA family protein
MAAIDVAIETCKRINGKLTVLAIKNKDVTDPEALVNEVAAKCAESGIEVEKEIAEGDIVDNIVGRSGKYDLVIMGTVRRGTVAKILSGRIAERVVISASCPVTIVRDF